MLQSDHHHQFMRLKELHTHYDRVCRARLAGGPLFPVLMSSGSVTSIQQTQRSFFSVNCCPSFLCCCFLKSRVPEVLLILKGPTHFKGRGGTGGRREDHVIGEFYLFSFSHSEGFSAASWKLRKGLVWIPL